MKLSAPIYKLKSQAKALKLSQSCSMAEALDSVAKAEGFSSWSLLMQKRKDLLPSRYEDIIHYFNGGDLILLGARPMVGKTSFATGLFVQSILQEKLKNYYFTLSEIERDVMVRMKAYAAFITDYDPHFVIDCADDICADYIIKITKNEVGEGSFIVIDYMQQLDERRVNEPLQQQIIKLKEFAKQIKCTIILIAQIDRKFEISKGNLPKAKDVRLPNPLDLSLFNKLLFLRREGAKMEVHFSGRRNHQMLVSWNEKLQRVE